jgi:hypothetical protein
MPGLVPGIHDFLCSEDVDGRDKPGHDEWPSLRPFFDSCALRNAHFVSIFRAANPIL